jgi:hypothetical protein
MTEQNNSKNSLLNSYLIINQLLDMDFKSKYYKELKHRLSTEELEVVKYLQHARSLEKLKVKKENNLEVKSSRGRKKKNTEQELPPELPPNEEEMPPSYPS